MLNLEAYKSSTDAYWCIIYISVYFLKVCLRDYKKNCMWSASPLQNRNDLSGNC